MDLFLIGAFHPCGEITEPVGHGPGDGVLHVSAVEGFGRPAHPEDGIPELHPAIPASGAFDETEFLAVGLQPGSFPALQGVRIGMGLVEQSAHLGLGKGQGTQVAGLDPGFQFQTAEEAVYGMGDIDRGGHSR